MTAPEFSRIERVDQIGAAPRIVAIVADANERAALAARFGLLAVDALAATFTVRTDGGAILADGRVTASVMQACVASGEPLPATVDEPVALRFVAEDAASEDELELDDELVDTIPYDGAAIDLGEAAAETMVLALDPFPRAPDAAAVLDAAGVIGEDAAAPSGALAAALRAKLGDQSS